MWTGTATVDLGALVPLSSGSWSVANGINDSGQVVGYWATSVSTINTGAHPWLYSNGKMASLPGPSGLTTPSCHADMINKSGQIAATTTTETNPTTTGGPRPAADPQLTIPRPAPVKPRSPAGVRPAWRV